ncbi:MAG: hypothetical protein O7C59_06120, partial [Rickettsia endosymbiont of Ixodes persulcatus]|nr:hypothetical protein [Rickettsia endosymbiont of Ixodes persulcatus]
MSTVYIPAGSASGVSLSQLNKILSSYSTNAYVNGITSGYTTAISTLTADDATLTTGLSNEVSRSIAAESTISSNLSVETSNRQSANNNLTTIQTSTTSDVTQVNDTLTGYLTQFDTNFINVSSGNDLTIGNHVDCLSLEIANSLTNVQIYAASTTVAGTLTSDTLIATTLTVPAIDTVGPLSIGGGTCTELNLSNPGITTNLNGELNAYNINANNIVCADITATTSNITDLKTRL